MKKSKIGVNTRVYVAGCGGMLGAALFAYLSKLGATVKATDIHCNESWLEYGDVRDYLAISESIREFRPSLIINLAAITDLELCETNEDNAWLTNALGAENLGLVANELDVPYVYISTAGIFDGLQDVYNDFHVPNPLSVYAKSKHYGEQYALGNVLKSYVIRAGWMMGGGPAKDKKFINKIYKQIRAGATELCVVDDKLGVPTYTVDFSKGLCAIVESGQFGLYNQVCTGAASRFDVAEEFVRLLGLIDKVSVKVVQSDYFQNEYFAPRPPSEMLVNLKLNHRGLNVMRDWRVCLQEYTEVFKADLRHG